MFNTTFFAVSVACAYLCVNPLTKAVYVLRCFYGESLSSGDDLRLGIRRAAGIVAAMVALMFCLPAAAAARQAGNRLRPSMPRRWTLDRAGAQAR